MNKLEKWKSLLDLLVEEGLITVQAVNNLSWKRFFELQGKLEERIEREEEEEDAKEREDCLKETVNEIRDLLRPFDREDQASILNRVDA